ncbi:MAG: hypothetical protein GY952_18410 [Rhodobacteraceae bacterium]|nr:hypothetical protein [Paracoccaceae bacterium]
MKQKNPLPRLRIITPILAALASVVSITPALAETQIVCSLDHCETLDIKIDPFATASDFSVAEIWTIIDDILDVSGLVANFELVSTTDVGNAAALIIDETRYLAFNPDWLSVYKGKPKEKWNLYGVMAHEVGHHLQGHTLTKGGSKPPTELEADEYAGFVLAGLGADLDDAKTLWKSLSEAGSSTHPARADRLQAVARGWQRWQDRKPPTGTVSAGKDGRLRAGGERCSSAYYGLARGDICASSVLAGQSGNSYLQSNLLDGNPATAWVEGQSGDGIDAFLTLEFAGSKTVSELQLTNGYTKSDSIFTKNNRVRDIEVTSSTGQRLSAQLADHGHWQTISLPGFLNVDWIQIRILSVYRGTKYRDTAISELRVQ